LFVIKRADSAMRFAEPFRSHRGGQHMRTLHAWVCVAAIGFAAIGTPIGAEEGLKPPPVGTASVITIDGKYGGSLTRGEGQEPQQFDMPLRAKLELIGFGDDKSPRYVLLVTNADEMPFIQGQGMTFLKTRNGEIVEESAFQSFNLLPRLLLPLLSPRGLEAAQLKADTRDVSVSTFFMPFPTKIRCEVTLEEKPDGLHVARKLAPPEEKPADGKSADKPDEKPAEPKKAQPGLPKPDIRAWRDEFVLAKDTGLLVSSRSTCEIQMSFGEQSQVLNMDLTLKIMDRRALSAEQTAAVANDATRLQKLAKVEPVFSEEPDKLKAALAKIKKAEEELAAFAKERADSPLKSGVAAVRNQIQQQAEQIDAQLKEAAFLAEMIGKPAPDFTLKNLDDEDVTLSSFVAGKVALVSFWGYG
jgi:hypothetical protein